VTQKNIVGCEREHAKAEFSHVEGAAPLSYGPAVPVFRFSTFKKELFMTKRIKVTNQLGPLQTRDAERFDAFDSATALGAIVSALESTGLVEGIDLARIKAILQKYVGGSSATTNAVGVTRAGDAVDAGQKAAAVVRANIEHNAEVGRGYRDFWSQ
jgi:hypothetical protein